MRHAVYASWSIEITGDCLREETDDGFVIFHVARGERSLQIFTVVYVKDNSGVEFGINEFGDVLTEDDYQDIRIESAAETLQRYLAGAGWPETSAHPFNGNSDLAGYCQVDPGSRGAELLFHALVAGPTEILVISSDCSQGDVAELLEIWQSANKG